MEEKLDSSCTGRPSENLTYLPIKKRRHLLRTPSPPPLPPPPQTPLENICAQTDTISNPEPMASNSLVEVPKNQGIENALANTNVDANHNAKMCVDKNNLLTSQGTDMYMPTVNKPNACIEGEIWLSKDSISGAHSDTRDRIDLKTASSNVLEMTEKDAEKSSSSASDARLHWDLNTVMDEWGLPVDHQNDRGKGNNRENISSEGLPSVVPLELPTRAELKDSEVVLKLLNCRSDINCPAQPISKTELSDSRSSYEGNTNTSTKLTMLLGQTIPVKNVKLEKQDDIPVASIVSDKSVAGVVCVKSEKEHVKTNNEPFVGNLVSKFTIPSGSETISSRLEKTVSPNSLHDNLRISPVLSTLNICQPTPENIKKENDTCLPRKVAPLGSLLSDIEMKEFVPKSDELLGPPKIVTLVNPPLNVDPKEPTLKSHEQIDPSKVVNFVKTSSNVETEKLSPKSYEQFGPREVIPLANSSLNVERSKLMPKSYEQSGPSKVVNLVNSSSDIETKELMLKSLEQFGPSKVVTLANNSSNAETFVLMPKSYELLSPPKVVTYVNPSFNVETKELMPKSYEQFGPSKVVNLANNSSNIETKELMPKSFEKFGDVPLEDPVDDGDVSDLSLGGLAKATKYKTGYESPFEDGELRERNALSWEENDCETECLDYDIDERETCDFGTDNHCMSEAGSESIQNEDNVKSMEKGACGSVNSLKESSNSTSVENDPGQDQIAMVVEANNSKIDEMVVSESIHRLDTKGSFTEDIRSRAKLSARVGESPASDVFEKKDDTLYIQQSRSRFQAGQTFRCDKYTERDRRVPHIQEERHKSNWNGSASSFSRNHFHNNNQNNNQNNNYRRGGILPLPRSNLPDRETNSERLSYRDQRGHTNFSEKGLYRPLVRRRSLDNNDHACSSRRENNESRDDGTGLNRDRSGIYHRGGFRGPRNPSFSRRSRSRSRSRTRSPIPWRMQEERSKGTRIDRTRVHYENRKFEENDDSFCSPPRKRFFNDRSDGPSRFGGRKSPGGFVVQRQRFDRGSVERMKSDDGFRPNVRFSKPSGEVWRGNNYDKNSDNERTNYNDRNEMIRRVRHSDNGGSIKRFRNNGDACFDGRNNRIDNGWEGRGPFKYDRERM